MPGRESRCLGQWGTRESRFQWGRRACAQSGQDRPALGGQGWRGAAGEARGDEQEWGRQGPLWGDTSLSPAAKERGGLRWAPQGSARAQTYRRPGLRNRTRRCLGLGQWPPRPGRACAAFLATRPPDDGVKQGLAEGPWLGQVGPRLAHILQACQDAVGGAGSLGSPPACS